MIRYAGSVISNFDLNLLSLKKSDNFSYKKKINLIEFPDLYQPIRCTIFGLNLKTKLLGTTTLVDKETNRLVAMDNELKRIVKNKSIRTYDDHRMAMSFAPLSLIYDEVKIENIAVVSKSYKNFWRDLKKAGFKICPSID